MVSSRSISARIRSEVSPSTLAKPASPASNTRRRCCTPRRIGVSGFLTSCATWRATSPQASTRSARATSVTSSKARTTPPPPSEASCRRIRRPADSSSTAVAGVWAVPTRRSARRRAATATPPPPVPRSLLPASSVRPSSASARALATSTRRSAIERHDPGGNIGQHRRGPPPRQVERLLAGPHVGRHPLDGGKDRLELERRPWRRPPAAAIPGRPPPQTGPGRPPDAPASARPAGRPRGPRPVR